MSELPSANDGPDEELDDPWHDQIVEVTDSFGAPEVQSLVAFVLALMSMGGIGLVNGSYYLFTSISADTDYKTQNVAAALLGAAFALIPVALGWRASARVLETDPRWVATFARAAVILGLLSVVLRLVLAVIAASAHDPRAGIGHF
jgi:uncharacterized protein YacL